MKFTTWELVTVEQIIGAQAAPDAATFVKLYALAQRLMLTAEEKLAVGYREVSGQPGEVRVQVNDDALALEFERELSIADMTLFKQAVNAGVQMFTVQRGGANLMRLLEKAGLANG